MITMKTNSTAGTIGRLDFTALRELASIRCDCWTILLPATHPGTGEGSKLVAMRSLAHSLGVVGRTEWLERLEIFLLESKRAGGGPGLALFASEGHVAGIEAHVTRERIAQGPHFYLVPLIEEAQVRREFYVLGLSKKAIRWIEYSNGACRELALPAGLAAGLDEFHGLEVVDGEFPSPPERVEPFFAAIDEGLAKVAGDRPVLLIGVVEELAAFRRVSKRLKLFEDRILGAVRNLALSEIAQLSGACATQEQHLLAKLALNRVQEWPDRSRVEEDLDRIVVEAAGGQVETLCLKESDSAGALVGPMEEAQNSAAVEAIAHGGRVHVLARNEMRVEGEAVALLRY